MYNIFLVSGGLVRWLEASGGLIVRTVTPVVERTEGAVLTVIGDIRMSITEIVVRMPVL